MRYAKQMAVVAFASIAWVAGPRAAAAPPEPCAPLAAWTPGAVRPPLPSRLGLPAPARAVLPPEERAALVALYQGTGGELWTDRTNWLGPEGSEGTWYGVYLTEDGTHVAGLILHENNLTGSLPPEIGDLPYLTDLALGGNHLTGPLPDALGNLSALVRFIAWGNGFAGSIPWSLHRLSALAELDLGGNGFSGEIPPQLGEMSSLESLFLNDNLLSGTPPASLGQLAGLRHLALNGNALTGAIPAQWAGLTSLELLWLSENPLGGALPEWLGNLPALREVDLSSCALTGEIPPSLGDLAHLENLVLNGNRLAGSIPDSLGNLSQLRGLGLQGNDLTGSVPAGIWNLGLLEYLDLSENDLSGPLPEEVNGLSDIVYLMLQDNAFEGPVPPGLGALPSILHLNLGRNRLSGTIPAELGNLPTLQVLGLSGNALGGEIPASLLNLTALEEGWGIGLEFNALHTTDETLREFLHRKGDEFEGSQTVAPTGVAVQAASGGTARLTWTPIAYNWDGGGYRILAATDPGGPFAQVAVTADKDAESAEASGLQPATTYYFSVQSFTAPHELNPNIVESERTAPLPFTTASCALSCRATATPPAGPASLPVQFQSLVTSPGCTGTPTLRWDFGDGTSSTEEAPLHTYRYTGWYDWTLRAEVDGQVCTTGGVVEVGVGVATGDGSVAVGSWDQRFVLDGPGITGAEVRLFDGEGAQVALLPVTAGLFTLPELPTGDYSAALTLTYEDHITADALWGTYGCAGPGTVLKKLEAPPEYVQLGGGYNRVDLMLPPPLVLLHGPMECYRKWTSEDLSAPDHLLRWDNAARARGVITFTPNYPGWDAGASWDSRAQAVLDQVAADLSRLRAGTSPPGPVPYAVLGHDMGGLVARAIAGGPRWDDPLVLRMQNAYLLGTPNSGSDYLLGGGEETPLGEEAIQGTFNEVYPDFGMATVYAIAGDAGWWASKDGDGPVTLYSAFNISRVACSGSASGFRCTPYVWTSFDSGEGHIFPCSHRQLGEPATTASILLGTILPTMDWYRGGEPESPAGGTMWGTGARTVGTAQGSTQARAGGGLESLIFPFTISPSEGMGVLALVRRGSARFDVLDPSGALAGSQTLPEPAPDADGPGMEFLRVAPPRGTWALRVTPGEQGATFQAVMVESSAFDIFGYLGREVYGTGEAVQIHLEAKGDLTGVTFTGAEAVLSDPYGTPFDPVPLYDDGQHGDGSAGDGHYGGTLLAPDSPDSYEVIFSASGYYQNPSDTFGRETDARLEVIRTDHLFTGQFSDAPEDLDGDGRSDALAFSASFQAPASGSYFVSGELYDANGYWVDYASASVDAEAPGPASASIVLNLAGATCDQFAGPFSVEYIELLDASTFETLDFWYDPVYTATYVSADFECLQGSAGPEAYEVYPDQGAPGRTLELLISGSSFTDETSVQFSGGLTLAAPPVRFSPYLLSAQVVIPADAAPGFRSLTVANPGTVARTLNGAFEVRVDGAPEVEVISPWDGDTVTGTVWLAASAWDDGRVERVTFRVDGAEVATVTSLPFQMAWDSASVANGAHALSALAEDDTGKVGASAEVTVYAANATTPGDCDGDGAVSIGEVQRTINMFLGIAPVECGADCSGDGVVSIGEVQKVINAFLGSENTC